MKYLLRSLVFLAPFTLFAESEDLSSDTETFAVQESNTVPLDSLESVESAPCMADCVFNDSFECVECTFASEESTPSVPNDTLADSEDRAQPTSEANARELQSEDAMNHQSTKWENLQIGFIKLFENDPATALMYFSDVLERTYNEGLKDPYDDLGVALLGILLCYDRLDMTDAAFREAGRFYIELSLRFYQLDNDENFEDEDEDDDECLLKALQEKCQLLPETLNDMVDQCHSPKIKAWISQVLLQC